MLQKKRKMSIGYIKRNLSHNHRCLAGDSFDLANNKNNNIHINSVSSTSSRLNRPTIIPNPKIPPPPTNSAIKAMKIREGSEHLAGSAIIGGSNNNNDDDMKDRKKLSDITVTRASDDSSSDIDDNSHDDDNSSCESCARLNNEAHKTHNKKNKNDMDQAPVLKMLSKKVGDIGVEMLQKLIDQGNGNKPGGVKIATMSNKENKQQKKQKLTAMENIIAMLNTPTLKNLLKSIY